MPEPAREPLRRLACRAALALQPLVLLALLLPHLLRLPADAGWRAVPAELGWYTVQAGPPPGAADAAALPLPAPVGLAVLPVQPGGRYRVTLSYQPAQTPDGPGAPPYLALRTLESGGLWPEFRGAAPAAPGPHTADPADPACLQWTAEVTVRPQTPNVVLLMEPALPLCRVTLATHAPTLWLRAWQETGSRLAPAALAVEALALLTLAGLFRRELARFAGRAARELAALAQAVIAQVREVAALLLVVLAVTLGADWKWGLHAQFAALWIGAVLLRRLSGRDSILAALLTLLTCPVLLIARQEKLAETMGDLTYILLVIGVVQQAVELWRERGAAGEAAQAGEGAAPVGDARDIPPDGVVAAGTGAPPPAPMPARLPQAEREEREERAGTRRAPAS